MNRADATHALRELMNTHGLQDWSIRLNQDDRSGFLGLCSYKDKCIILSAHHVDIHPVPDIMNTIRHEVAHALTPGASHGPVWIAKAKELGCDNTSPCSNLGLDPRIIDAIRSGATIEVSFDEKTVQVATAFEEQVIRTPKYVVTRLQDKCDVCGKVAKTASEKILKAAREDAPDLKMITLECGHIITKKIPKGTPFHTFQMGGDPNCKHQWDKNNCILCNRKRPYPFQLEGMKFLETALAVNNGGAVFDEMGLGKTIQAGGVLKFHPELWPTLWIVKSGIKYQTASFIINWMGTDHVPQIIDSSKDWLIPNLKNYIISYDMLVPKTKTMKSGKVVNSGFDITQFERIGIKCVVLDECQQIKNVDSSRTQMVRRVVKGKKVIPLSGTPWNNRGSELYPVLNMLDYNKFSSAEGFKRRWVDTYWSGNQLKEGGIRNILAFKEFTKDLCIRRERKDVMPELPTTNRTKLMVKMDLTQEQIYDDAVENFVTWFEEQQGAITGMAIIAAMQKMRHLVALAKIPATMEYVHEFVEDTDKKIVVFAHHKDVQDMLYDQLHEYYDRPSKPGETDHEQIPVLKLFADTNPAERFQIQEKFNRLPRVIMVASQLAAGEGLNLQTCCDCVMHERQWNPGKEQQCEDRFARIGSTATSVSAVYAHLEGLTTIDPQLDQIVERKRIQFHNVMNSGDVERWNEDSIMKELAETIVNAHNAKRNRRKVG